MPSGLNTNSLWYFISKKDMTTFILQRGRTSNPSKQNNDFFTEIIEQTPPGGRILCIYFARPEEERQNKFDQDKIFFAKADTTNQSTREIISDDIETAVKQIKQAKTIYISGGNTYQLLEHMRQIPDVGELLKNKILAGSSAGAYIYCKYFYNGDDTIGEGLNLLPAKIIGHYNENRKNDLEKLKLHQEDLPVYTLQEQEFILINM